MKYKSLDLAEGPAKGFIFSSSDFLIKCSFNKMTKQHKNSFIKRILRLASTLKLGPSELRYLLLTIYGKLHVS